MAAFWAPCALSFAISLAVLINTLYKSIPGGDSGELVAESCKLGVAHPPGYPLFTLLTYPVTLLGPGAIAWRSNALTAGVTAWPSALGDGPRTDAARPSLRLHRQRPSLRDLPHLGRPSRLS